MCFIWVKRWQINDVGDGVGGGREINVLVWVKRWQINDGGGGGGQEFGGGGTKCACIGEEMADK